MLSAFGWRDTFLYLGIAYFIATIIGAFTLRTPPAGWRPAGWEPAASFYDLTDRRSRSRT